MSCAHRGPDAAKPALTVATSGLDPFEQAALGVLRFMASSFAHPASQHWMQAMHLSVHAWGPSRGPALCHTLLNVMNAMRSTRRPDFRFSNPACPVCREQLTQHERHLIVSIHHARRGERTALNATAAMLCCGTDAEPFIAAVDRIVREHNLTVVSGQRAAW
jgi:hypothetical protein